MVKSHTLARVKGAHTAGAYPGFCSMKQLRVLLLPARWDASPSQGYPQQIKLSRLSTTGARKPGLILLVLSDLICLMLQVSVHKRDPSDEISDAIVDLAMLTMSEHFIGNCVSSFTSFVTRYRSVDDKPTSFWAFDEEK